MLKFVHNGSQSSGLNPGVIEINRLKEVVVFFSQGVRKLTLYMLTSAFIFSTPFSIHLPRCWRGDFVKQSWSFVGDLDSNMWVRVYIDASYSGGVNGFYIIMVFLRVCWMSLTHLLHPFWNYLWFLQSDWLSPVQFIYKSQHFRI